MTDSRLGNLGSILNAPQRPRLVPTEPTADEAPATTPTAATPRVVREKAARTPAPTAGKADSPTRRVPVRIEPALRARLEHVVRNTPGATVTTVALDAIERLHERGQLKAAVAALQEQPAGGGLFHRPVRQTAQAKVTIELRVPANDLKTLDHLKDQAAADSRSHLITAALMAELPS